MRRLMLVEELNKEVTVEPTVEEKTKMFKDWVAERISNSERTLSITANRLELWFNQGEPVSDSVFDNQFELEYFFINEDIYTAKGRCKADDIADDVLEEAIKEFKQMKSKVRKVKAEYKKKLTELREAIALSLLNEEDVAVTANLVRRHIVNWCSTYVIKDSHKAKFKGFSLEDTVNFVTRQALESRLKPSDEFVVEHVERFMRNYTETVEC